MKRYSIRYTGFDHMRQLWEGAKMVGSIFITIEGDPRKPIPESARRLRALAAAPEMLSLLEHIERWYSDPRDPISAEVSNQITNVLEYIKTGEET